MRYIETLLQDIRVKLPNTQIMKDEWRMTRYGMLTAAKAMTKSPMSIANSKVKEAALNSEGNTLGIPVIKIGDVSVGNVRSCQIEGFDLESEIVEVVWSTVTFDIKMIKEQHQNNEVSYLEDFQKKWLLAGHAVAKACDELIYAKLDTEKSQVHGSSLVGDGLEYPVVGDAIQVAADQQELFFNDMDTILEEDDFYTTNLKVLASTSMKPSYRHYSNQGSANDENLSYQFAGYDWTFTNHIPVSAGQKSAGFIMPDGAIAFLTRLNADARAKNKTTTGVEWDTTFLPILDEEVGVMYYSSCEDLSEFEGMEHLTATMVERWQLSIDVATLTAYNSDPANKAGSIRKVELLNN